jgi:putative glycerol-1-phosphate prenyltransferase
VKILESIREKAGRGKKQFAVLVDPDKATEDRLAALCRTAEGGGVDYFFVGGSLLVNDSLARCVASIKANCQIPVVLFPGSALQIARQADALLFLSLISGRNPELLIGKHVAAAPMIREYGLEAIPTGYLLIDGGNLTSVQYISNTRPIPADKPDIAAYTALAGELLGMQCIFMDAGSGAKNPVSETVIGAVRRLVHVPVIVGGGIRTPEQAAAAARAGADLVVVGNAIEKEPGLAASIGRALQAL